MNEWYGDWQHPRHAVVFDGRSRLEGRNLVRNFEAFNDVRLLNERLPRSQMLELLEIGCATGEFYRYLRLTYPRLRYYGVDVSSVAVERANAKYPEAGFFVVAPAVPLRETLTACGIPAHPAVIYAKDVVHHQVDPFGFLGALIEQAREAVIVRCRTRDRGATELNPELSCQSHYEGWVPYIVLNVQQLIDRVRAQAPAAEVVIYRHHVVLGGEQKRFLPKELCLKETGTAETAVGVFKKTEHPGRVIVEDRPDQNPSYTWDYRVKHALRQAWNALYLRQTA
jgi:SAM-dependent methyltransferase